jgi:hypothetical protein
MLLQYIIVTDFQALVQSFECNKIPEQHQEVFIIRGNVVETYCVRYTS